MNKLKVYSVAAVLAVAGVAGIASGAFAAAGATWYDTANKITVNANGDQIDDVAGAVDLTALADQVEVLEYNGTYQNIMDTWENTRRNNATGFTNLTDSLASAPKLVLNVSGTATPNDANSKFLANFKSAFTGGITTYAAALDLTNLTAATQYDSANVVVTSRYIINVAPTSSVADTLAAYGLTNPAQFNLGDIATDANTGRSFAWTMDQGGSYEWVEIATNTTAGNNSNNSSNSDTGISTATKGGYTGIAR